MAGGVGSGAAVGLASDPAPLGGFPLLSRRFMPAPRDMVLSARSRDMCGRKSVDELTSAMAEV